MFSVGSVFATTFRIWLRQLPRLVLLALICFAPVIGFYQSMRIEAVKDFVSRHYFQPVFEKHPALQELTGANWITSGLLYGAIAAFVVVRVRGERIGAFRAVGRALRRGGSLLGVSLIAHLATVGVITAIVMIVWSRDEWIWRGGSEYGGLYIWALWGGLWVVLRSLLCIVYAIAVTERRGPLAAVARNLKLTHGHRIKVFAIVLVLWALVSGANWFAYELMLSDLDTYRQNFEIYAWVRFAIEVLFTTLSATALGVTYEQLREAREGPTPDALDRVFA